MADKEKDIRDSENQTPQEEVMSRLHGDKVIWAIFFLLSLISIALIYSASSSLAYMKGSTNFAILMKQIRFVVLGIGALFICYKIPPKWYRAVSMLTLLLAIVLLVLTLAVGVKTNDAQRWLSIGGLQFQPTEFAKIAIVLYLARALEIMKIDTYKSFLLKIIATIGVCIVLVLVGSVSAALYLALICFIVLFIAGIKPSYLIKTVGLGVAAVVLLIVVHLASKPFTSEHRGVFPRMDTAIERFNRFFSSDDDIDVSTLDKREQQRLADETLQADMAQIAVKEGGLLGKGPGKSTQRYVLPHPYSDYIYSIILEEYGLWGGILVMMLLPVRAYCQGMPYGILRRDGRRPGSGYTGSGDAPHTGERGHIPCNRPHPSADKPGRNLLRDYQLRLRNHSLHLQDKGRCRGYAPGKGKGGKGTETARA